MFENYIKYLNKKLKKTLPGEKAQNKMAPTKHLSNIPIADNIINSAVLLLLYPHNNNIYTLLIQRPIYNGQHSGQISFPGGKYEITDKNLTQTALRETYEEIGINPTEIEIIGNLSQLYTPVSNYKIYPFVGYLNKQPNFKINFEVEKILEINIISFSENNIHIIEKTSFDGYKFNTPVYKINNLDIWGATAMILSEFSEINNKIFTHHE